MALHFVLTAFMLGAWMTARTGVGSRGTTTAGVLARLSVSFVAPFTTHDVSRHLRDGRVLLEGYDPYRLAPDAEALVALRAYWPTPAEHGPMPRCIRRARSHSSLSRRASDSPPRRW
jgi:hypothetical protein